MPIHDFSNGVRGKHAHKYKGDTMETTNTTDTTPTTKIPMTTSLPTDGFAITPLPLAGLSFCITGRTMIKRAQLQEIIEENGGTLIKAVKEGCSYLIIADPTSTTVKANSARDLGVKLISEDEFFEMLDE